jgi:TrmH family RNA methyltransferase
MPEIITSSANTCIKQIIKLKQSVGRKKSGLFLIEGKAEISLAIKAGIEIDTLFFCPQLAKEKSLSDQINYEKIKLMADNIFKKISFRENPDGFMAIAKQKILKIDKIKISKNPLILILESVEKPGNLGAIMRTADAAGVEAVIVCDPKTDIYNPNVIRSSLGAVFTVQVAVGKTAEAIRWLNSKDIRIYSATPSASKFYYECDLSKSSAVVIGTEHDGLSDKWLNAANEKIKIPMHGRIDSLNASVSAGVIVYEAIRQKAGIKNLK